MNIFDFQNFSELIFCLCDKTPNKGCRSYAGLSRRLGIKSPRVLAMVAKKQRPPSLSLVQKICDYLKATAEEKDFLLLLAEKCRCELKKSPIDHVEKKIEVYRSSKKDAAINIIFIAGIKIEFSKQVDPLFLKKLEELVCALVMDSKEFIKDRVET